MRVILHVLAICSLTAGLVAIPGPASACETSAATTPNSLTVNVGCPKPRAHTQPKYQDLHVGPARSLAPVLPTPNADAGACGAAATVTGTACTAPPAAPAAALPRITAGLVLRAFQRIPVPHLRSQTQPDDKTLVNFDTIFYVDAAQFQRTVTLLGRRVTLEITPSTFLWRHGDGTSTSTSNPGARYPSKDVVYRYQKAHRTVAHSVMIVWTARYRVGDGAWQPVPGTVTTTGPTTDLRIAEATPVLTGQR